jgi:uncharacterized protein
LLRIFNDIPQWYCGFSMIFRNSVANFHSKFMVMITRYYQLINDLESSVFFFGSRQTGKSTFLRQKLPKTIFIDLLDSRWRMRFQSHPEALYDMLRNSEEGTIVVIDEIPEVPELLNEVHRLIFERKIVFVLCGSSARKLKRKGHNTLGGRAYPCFFYPLVSAEVPNFDLDHVLVSGMLPMAYLSKNPERYLASYVDVYLREEIREEALVRNFNNFQRFLEVAALTDGEMVNYTNIASDCGVSANTVKGFFGILEDTLIGYMIPAFNRTQKRRVSQAPRFYFFDVGVTQYLLRHQTLKRGTPEFGHAFEHFVVQELIAYIGYNHKRERLSYWHTHSGMEVDVVIGDAQLAIEIKSVDCVQSKHLGGLRAFKEEFTDCRCVIVSLDIVPRMMGDVQCVYLNDFLAQLWRGEWF